MSEHTEYVLNLFSLWAWTVFFAAKTLIFGYGAWTTWSNRGKSRLAKATKWFFTAMCGADTVVTLAFGIAAIDTTDRFNYDPSLMVRVFIRIGSLPFLLFVVVTGIIFVITLRNRMQSLIRLEEAERLAQEKAAINDQRQRHNL